jgi:hypothetical protein
MPFGLRPVRYKGGAPYNGAANVYSVASGESNAIFVGDPVIISGTGDTDGVPGVARAGAGDRITGVVVGFAPNPSATGAMALNRGYRTASTADYLLVADDPNLIFEATEDAVGGALATGDIGNNVDLVAGSGSTVTKLSGYMLDSSSKVTTTAQVRLVGKSPRVNNAIGTVSTVWLVAIVEATEPPADASVTGV